MKSWIATYKGVWSEGSLEIRITVPAESFEEACVKAKKALRDLTEGPGREYTFLLRGVVEE